MSKKRKVRWGWLAAAVPAAVGLWITGDWLYHRHVQRGYRRWEAGVERDPDGVRKGCHAFSMGAGEPAILLVHGYGDCPAVWRPMAERLAAAGFHVRALRLPGHAMPIEEYAQTDLAAWRALVDDELSALRAEHDAVWLCGHSMGAAMCIDHIRRHPGEIAGLIALAPLIEVARQRSPLLTPEGWFQLTEYSLHFTDTVEQLFEPHVSDPAHIELLRLDRYVPRNVFRALFTLVNENRGCAPDLQLPLFMAATHGDVVVDTPAIEQFFAAAAATHKELRFYDRMGHAMPVDLGWQDLTDAIIAFIRTPHQSPGGDGQ